MFMHCFMRFESYFYGSFASAIQTARRLRSTESVDFGVDFEIISISAFTFACSEGSVSSRIF